MMDQHSTKTQLSYVHCYVVSIESVYMHIAECLDNCMSKEWHTFLKLTYVQAY